MRDLLLGRTPIFWVVDSGLSILTFAVALFSFYRLNQVSNKLLVIADAIGLGIFSILGATYALQTETPSIVAVLMGVITGIFGGVLRDLLCNRIPNVFRQSTELYATCSFIGTWVFIALVWLKMDSFLASAVGAGVIFTLRLAAVRYKVTLPSP